MAGGRYRGRRCRRRRGIERGSVCLSLTVSVLVGVCDAKSICRKEWPNRKSKSFPKSGNLNAKGKRGRVTRPRWKVGQEQEQENARNEMELEVVEGGKRERDGWWTVDGMERVSTRRVQSWEMGLWRMRCGPGPTAVELFWGIGGRRTGLLRGWPWVAVCQWWLLPLFLFPELPLEHALPGRTRLVVVIV